jgi:hypothetical protein
MSSEKENRSSPDLEKPSTSAQDYSKEDPSSYDAALLKDQLGYEPELNLHRNRSLYTLLFQSLGESPSM